MLAHTANFAGSPGAGPSLESGIDLCAMLDMIDSMGPPPPAVEPVSATLFGQNPGGLLTSVLPILLSYCQG